MKTLTQLEVAADALPSEDKRALVRFLLARLGSQPTDASEVPPQGHSLLDIEPVCLGRVLRPVTPDDDLLGEMLEGRT